MILEKIRSTDLHDMPAVSLEFDFQNRSACFVFDQYDDLIEGYVPIKLHFKGVYRFYSHYPEGLRFEVSACKSCRARQNDEGGFEIKFLLEIDDDIPAYTLEIGFMDLEITSGRSPEAQAHRDAYFEEITRGRKDEE